MAFSKENTETLNRLVGDIDENTRNQIYENIDCFLHPLVSMFLPSRGLCKYAITPSHTHPAYSFIYYLESYTEFIIEGKHVLYEFSDGKNLVALSPNIIHQEPKKEGFKCYIAIMIDKGLFQEIFRQYSEALPIFCGERFMPHAELLGLLKCFMLEAGELECSNVDYLNQLAMSVVHLIVRTVLNHTSQIIPLYNRFEINRAIAYMTSHYNEKIKLEDLAVLSNLSSSHFTKIFKTVTGETPIDYLKKLRLKKAHNMLFSNIDNITEIALKCGFSTPSYFTSCFTEEYHMSPITFRQKLLQQKSENIDKTK